jgi:hypothetical protein
VVECLRLVRRYRPQALWSTFPIATAHLIALTVQRLTGLPWVADFRDPMLQEAEPLRRFEKMVWTRLEGSVVRRATRCVFVTRGAREQCQVRYGRPAAEGLDVIENGYDEAVFAEAAVKAPPARAPGRIRLLHSGILYADGRNPLPFFNALREFVEERGAEVEVVLRGCGDDAPYSRIAAELGLGGVVRIAPPVPYREAIAEMLASDALLLFQGPVYGKQVPAKAYEYVRSGRPILALTDRAGDTARMLGEWDGVYMADMGSSREIKAALAQLVTGVSDGVPPARGSEEVARLSRRSRTRELARLLDGLTDGTKFPPNAQTW